VSVLFSPSVLCCRSPTTFMRRIMPSRFLQPLSRIRLPILSIRRRWPGPTFRAMGPRCIPSFTLQPGEGLHPTVLMLHGFPGNEKNLDLAYSMRRAGWNVLVPFYRGAWGSGSSFSFIHALEDAQASIDFLRDPENVTKFRIDPAHICAYRAQHGRLCRRLCNSTCAQVFCRRVDFGSKPRTRLGEAAHERSS
jgi:hypothetical protein